MRHTLQLIVRASRGNGMDNLGSKIWAGSKMGTGQWWFKKGLADVGGYWWIEKGLLDVWFENGG